MLRVSVDGIFSHNAVDCNDDGGALLTMLIVEAATISVADWGLLASVA